MDYSLQKKIKKFSSFHSKIFDNLIDNNNEKNNNFLLLYIYNFDEILQKIFKII